MVPKAAIILALEKEIEHARSCLQPHDTGHIHTAISWMTHRVRELKEELDAQYSRETG